MIAEHADQGFGEIWLKVSGLRVRCLTAGAAGPAVLLLHGSALDAAGMSFASAISALAAGCRVFAPDLPGFGESDPMPDGWGFADYSAFLLPLLTELDLQRASLAGVSMGGGIALGFALEAPERVERLVLIDSACLCASRRCFSRCRACCNRHRADSDSCRHRTRSARSAQSEAEESHAARLR